MALKINEDCINCGACEPSCPNTAIYPNGEPWELNGQKFDPISADFYYIVPDKCTECVGFYDEPQCKTVCPVDCIIPDPDRQETKEELQAKKVKLHGE